MARTPMVYRQNFRENDVIDGTAYTGSAAVDQTEPYEYVQNPAAGQGAITGGLIPFLLDKATNSVFRYPLMQIEAFYIYADGATSIDVQVYDPDYPGGAQTIVSGTTDTLLFATLDRAYLIPYGWRVRVVTNGAPLDPEGGYIYMVFGCYAVPPA